MFETAAEDNPQDITTRVSPWAGRVDVQTYPNGCIRQSGGHGCRPGPGKCSSQRAPASVGSPAG